MNVPEEKILKFARQAETPVLLDRVTVLRAEMEPDAVEIFLAELARRGIGPEDIRDHEREWKHKVLKLPGGLPATCSWCGRAATVQRQAWHKFLRLIPIYKRTQYYCDEHAPPTVG
jgi:hypothetical protein